ncbi:hypothetical protein [Roseibium aggregatum]|uniref:Uncharacterized protein n=1 Tax=Roseibium aggregatum TaxID=187304 RepID=A0A926P4I7_9HYPH|nr:hypothetical protein [Roseibium aggregatum]MBD1549298.1 hypothetical protein [Roseibium aggregatum]
MRRLQVKLDQKEVVQIEASPIPERQSDHHEKSIDEWSELTVKNMFEAAERELNENEAVAQ